MTTSSMLMSVATAISIPLYNVAGRLAMCYRPVQVLAIGIGGRIVALAGLAIVAYTQPSFSFVPVLLLYGLFQGIWPLLGVASNDLAADLAPFGEGTAMGLFNAAAAIASALGAVVGGAVADMFGFAKRDRSRRGRRLHRAPLHAFAETVSGRSALKGVVKLTCTNTTTDPAVEPQSDGLDLS